MKNTLLKILIVIGIIVLIISASFTTLNGQTILCTKHYHLSTATCTVPFMDDTLYVTGKYLTAEFEFILIEIQFHGLEYLDALQKTKIGVWHISEYIDEQIRFIYNRWIAKKRLQTIDDDFWQDVNKKR